MSEAPDLTTVPNFDALEAWIAKLRAWATEIQKEYEDAEGARIEKQEEIDVLEREGRDQRNAIEELDTLHEQLLDVDRGLITLDDVMRGIRLDKAYW